MIGLILKLAIIFFLIGIFVRAFIEIEIGLIFVVFTWVFLFVVNINKKKIMLIILIGFSFLCFGYIRYHYSFPNINEDSIYYYIDENKERLLHGFIVEDPDRRRMKVNYIVDVSEIFIENKWRNVNGRILINSALYPEYNYGDEIELKGFLTKPHDFESFSYSNYLSLFDVYAVMNRPYIKQISFGHGNSFFGTLFWVKQTFEEQLNKLFPEPMASFEAGLLTGSRKGIPEELMNNFNLTGLTHIIAISGYNISLIIFLVSSLFSSTARNVKIPIIILFIVLFTLFVGASAAVVRAAIMGVISVLAMWFGRQSQVINALLLSAFFMILLKPQTLLFDVGFQLSFLATLGLIISGNYLKRLFSFIPETFGIQEAIAMTLSAQVFALPVILFNFGRLSLISPIANVMVAPFIPFAMLFGFLATVLSFLIFQIGFVIMFPAWLFLKIIVLITNFLANLPLASFEVQWFSIVYLFAYYIIFILGMLLYRVLNSRRRSRLEKSI